MNVNVWSEQTRGCARKTIENHTENPKLWLTEGLKVEHQDNLLVTLDCIGNTDFNLFHRPKRDKFQIHAQLINNQLIKLSMGLSSICYNLST